MARAFQTDLNHFDGWMQIAMVQGDMVGSNS